MPSKAAAYILFHTDACHLCELAAELIDSVGLDYALQDICDSTADNNADSTGDTLAISSATNNALAELYGTRIPVLRHLDSEEELNWPFDIDALQIFLQRHLR